jgi:hypothetical protein
LFVLKRAIPYFWTNTSVDQPKLMHKKRCQAFDKRLRPLYHGVVEVQRWLRSLCNPSHFTNTIVLRCFVCVSARKLNLHILKIRDFWDISTAYLPQFSLARFLCDSAAWQMTKNHKPLAKVGGDNEAADHFEQLQKKNSASLLRIYKGCNHGIMVIWV